MTEANNIVIKEDTSLPKAIWIRLSVTDPTIVNLGSPESETPGTCVRVLGEINCLLSENGAIVMTLGDGYSFLQCILMGHLATAYGALTLTLGTSIALHGEMRLVPEHDETSPL